MLVRRHWTLKLREDRTVQTRWRPTEDYENERGRLTTDGKLTVFKDYAWDGCSPKFLLFGWFVIGTPDGPIDIETGEPASHDESMTHDWGYQFMKALLALGITRKQIDAELDQGKGSKMPWWVRRLYYRVVRAVGGVFHWLNRK